MTIAISGPVTRTWQLVATAAGWEYHDESGARVVARLSLTTEQAWRLLTNNLPAAGQSRLAVSGGSAVTALSPDPGDHRLAHQVGVTQQAV